MTTPSSKFPKNKHHGKKSPLKYILFSVPVIDPILSLDFVFCNVAIYLDTIKDLLVAKEAFCVRFMERKDEEQPEDESTLQLFGSEASLASLPRSTLYSLAKSIVLHNYPFLSPLAETIKHERQWLSIGRRLEIRDEKHKEMSKYQSYIHFVDYVPPLNMQSLNMWYLNTFHSEFFQHENNYGRIIVESFCFEKMVGKMDRRRKPVQIDHGMKARFLNPTAGEWVKFESWTEYAETKHTSKSRFCFDPESVKTRQHVDNEKKCGSGGNTRSPNSPLITWDLSLSNSRAEAEKVWNYVIGDLVPLKGIEHETGIFISEQMGDLRLIMMHMKSKVVNDPIGLVDAGCEFKEGQR